MPKRMWLKILAILALCLLAGGWQAARAQTQDTAHLIVTLDQSGVTADFYVDGQLVAEQAASADLQVSASQTHRVEARNIIDPAANGIYRWRDASASVFLAPGEERTLQLRLVREYLKGFLALTCRINGAPPNSTAYCQPQIDGAAVDPVLPGQTREYPLDPGQHTVVVSAGPAAEWMAQPMTQRPRIRAGQTTRLTVTLTASPAPQPGTLLLAHSFAGFQSAQGGAADVGITAGPNSLLVATNQGVALLNKSGRVLATRRLDDLWRSVLVNGEHANDIRPVYDSTSGRFFLVAQGGVHNPTCTPACSSHFYLAVSRSSNPRGFTASDWYFYALDATIDMTAGGTVTTNTWVDFTSIGVSNQYVVLTGNMDRFTDDLGITSKIRVIDKSLVLNGSPVTAWIDFVGMSYPSGSPVFNIMPSIQYQPADMMTLLAPFGCGFIQYTVSGPASGPSLSQRDVGTGRWDCSIAANAPQPGGAPALASNWQGIFSQRPALNGGSLWAIESIAADFGGGPVSSARWVQIDAGAGSIVQEGLIGEASVWSIFPAIAANSQGNAAIVFSRSGPELFPSSYYTGQLASDAAGSVRPVTLLRAGAASFTNPTAGHMGLVRWGDYLDASIDPIDGTAWIAGQYVIDANTWGVWVGHLDWNAYYP